MTVHVLTPDRAIRLANLLKKTLSWWSQRAPRRLSPHRPGDHGITGTPSV
jgi:hypothetical protein